MKSEYHTAGVWYNTSYSTSMLLSGRPANSWAEHALEMLGAACLRRHENRRHASCVWSAVVHASVFEFRGVFEISTCEKTKGNIL